jgi:transcriptional regulator with XRE-family HTH domain
MKQTKANLLPSQERILQGLGENIRMARLRRDLSSAQVSERAGVARATLVRLEQGDGGVSLANLLKVLFALGLETDLQTVARDDAMGRRLQDLGLLERKRASKKEL